MTMEARVAVLEVKMAGVETAVHRLEARVDGMAARLDGVEASIGRLEGKIDALADTIAGLTKASVASKVIGGGWLAARRFAGWWDTSFAGSLMLWVCAAFAGTFVLGGWAFPAVLMGHLVLHIIVGLIEGRRRSARRLPAAHPR